MPEEATPPVEAPAPEAPAVNPAAPYSGGSVPQLIGEGFTFVDGWADKLTDSAFDETRAMLSQFKSLPDLANSFKELRTSFSKKTEGLVRIPGADASEEDMTAWRKALGVPDSPDGYELPVPDGLPEGFEFDPAALAPLKEKAHALGIAPAALAELVSFHIQSESAEIARLTQEAEQQAKAGQEQLRKEWGQNFEKNLALSERVKLTGGGLPEGHWGHSDPHVQRLLASLGSKLSEGSMSAHDAAVANLGPSNAARDVVFNPDNPLHHAYHNIDKDGNKIDHPNHESAMTQYRALLAEQHRQG
jgi:hypothetical protein